MLGQAEVQRVAFVVHVLHLCVKTVKQILRCLAAARSIVIGPTAALRHRVVLVICTSWRDFSHRINQTRATVLNVVLDEIIHPIPLPKQLYLLPARRRENSARLLKTLRAMNTLHCRWYARKSDRHERLEAPSSLHRSGELAKLARLNSKSGKRSLYANQTIYGHIEAFSDDSQLLLELRFCQDVDALELRLDWAR